MKERHKIFINILVVIFIAAGWWGFKWNKTINTQTLIPETARNLVINNGSSLTTISEKLVLIEGWTAEEIKNYLLKKGVSFTATEFKNLSEQIDWSQFSFSQALPEKKNLEGLLFPDTYFIYPETKLITIVQKMLLNLDQKLTPELLAKITKQGKSLYEILIMASIIEREVPDNSERPIVADIFWKRIESGMGLQADSTVNYITKGNKPAVTYEELKIDNPYNTYKYKGLPPGPISNPGISAIKAAINPQKSPYWYFLSKPSGETVFSETLDQHNTAKYKYLK